MSPSLAQMQTYHHRRGNSLLGAGDTLAPAQLRGTENLNSSEALTVFQTRNINSLGLFQGLFIRIAGGDSLPFHASVGQGCSARFALPLLVQFHTQLLDYLGGYVSEQLHLFRVLSCASGFDNQNVIERTSQGVGQFSQGLGND